MWVSTKFPPPPLDTRFRGQEEAVFTGLEYRSLHRGHGGMEAPDKLNLWSPGCHSPGGWPRARLDPQQQIISPSYHHRRPRSLLGGAGINKNPTRTQHSGCRHESAREASGSSLPGLSLPAPIRSSHHDHAAVPLPVRLVFLFFPDSSLPFSRFVVDNSTASSSPFGIHLLFQLLLCYASSQGGVGQHRLCYHLRFRDRGNPPGWARHEVREPGEPGQLGDMDIVRGRYRLPDAPHMEQNTSAPRAVVG